MPAPLIDHGPERDAELLLGATMGFAIRRACGRETSFISPIEKYHQAMQGTTPRAASGIVMMPRITNSCSG